MHEYIEKIKADGRLDKFIKGAKASAKSGRKILFPKRNGADVECSREHMNLLSAYDEDGFFTNQIMKVSGSDLDDVRYDGYVLIALMDQVLRDFHGKYLYYIHVIAQKWTSVGFLGRLRE